MIGSDRETIPNVWKDLMDIQEWSVGPLGCPGVVESPSRMSKRPSRMSGSGQEALSDVR